MMKEEVSMINAALTVRIPKTFFCLPWSPLRISRDAFAMPQVFHQEYDTIGQHECSQGGKSHNEPAYRIAFLSGTEGGEITLAWLYLRLTRAGPYHIPAELTVTF
jgi:hypothetical protein